MDEYIKKDDAIRAALKGASLHYHDQFGAVDIAAAIDELPTADVAPRAEVAREIFADLEKIMQKGEERIYYKAEFGEFITREPDEVIPWGQLRLSEFDALKKKYTEGKDESKST